jgi:hypothetical protein
MSELLTQWSGIMAFLGDEGSRDGFQNTNYSSSPNLKPEQLMAVNKKLVEFLESLDQHPDQKDELLEMMHGFDPTNSMRGGKKTKKSRKTRRNRRA